MKYIHLFSCALIAHLTLHSMEQDKQISPWQAINCAKVRETLKTDYRNYVQSRLLDYKKTTLTSKDMDHIRDLGVTYTGSSTEYYSHVFYVRDEDENDFTKIAVQKFDLPMVQWLVAQCYITYPLNKEKKGCIELCIDHLSPANQSKINDEQKKSVYEMLDILTKTYEDELSFNSRKSIVEALITLRINFENSYKYADLPLLKNEFFTRFTTKKNKDPLDLNALYQTVTATPDLHTLSHMMAKHRDANQLYELIKNDYVSPIKNKDGKTVLDVALYKFQKYIKNLNAKKIEVDNARCCLFMLLKYIKSKQAGALTNDVDCCSKHPITADFIK